MIQPEPGALGVQGIVAIDATGKLVYCAPGVLPATGVLTPPDIGWGQIQAVDLIGNSLYVLDPKANQVWLYTAADGLFVGAPAIYFTEVIQSLNHAVDLAASQDELIVLHDDGLVDVCRRPEENAPDGSLRIRVECEKDLHVAPADVTPTSVVYSPPAGAVAVLPRSDQRGHLPVQSAAGLPGEICPDPGAPGQPDGPGRRAATRFVPGGRRPGLFRPAIAVTHDRRRETLG